MKICHILESSGGGSGRTALFIVHYLIEQGHEVTLIYSPLRAEAEFIKTAQSISGLRILPLKMKRSLSLHDAGALCGLCKLLRQHGPFDIIHSHSSKAGGLARLAGLFLPGAKHVYTPHAFVTMDPRASRLYAVLEWILGWCCDAIILVSKVEHRHAVNTLHFSRRKLSVIPNGARQNYPATYAQARQMLGCGEEEKVIGFVGRMSAQKRPDRAIEAFSKIANAYPQARLAMVGTGPLAEAVRKGVRARKLQDRVDFYTGYDARDLMPGFDALLCSSDYEGFANIFLEALNQHVPIVTTPVGGVQEAVIPGKTGFVTEGFSSEELAAALAKVLDLSPRQREEWARFSNHHKQNFTLEKMGRKTLDLYRRVMRGKKPHTEKPKPRLLYVINSFASGGAEGGLLTLVRHGFFDDFDLHIVALASGAGPVYRHLTDLLGVERVSFLRRAAHVSDWRLPFFIGGLIRVFYRLKSDIVILSLPQSVLCGRIASLFYPRAKLAVFEHSVDHNRKMAAYLLQLTAWRTDLVLGDTRATLQAWAGHYAGKTQLEVPLSIVESVPPRIWHRPEVVHVLSMGRLVPQKNYAELLRGVAELIKAGYKIRLDLAGEGPLRQELGLLAARLGIRRHVHFHGFVQDKSKLFEQAHIYIQPSLREGLAISVLEAMAAGLVVVASDVGGIRDYGTHRTNMIKIPAPASAQDIAAALRQAIDSYAENEALGQAAQKTVRELFNEQAVKQKWGVAKDALRQLAIARDT